MAKGEMMTSEDFTGPLEGEEPYWHRQVKRNMKFAALREHDGKERSDFDRAMSMAAAGVCALMAIATRDRR